MFAGYDYYLGDNFSIDFWSDVGLCAACALVSGFSADDWNSLAKKWHGRPAAWKARCAQTLDAHRSPLALDILLDMLEEEDDDVVVAAADTIRSTTKSALAISPPILARLAGLRDRSGIVDKIVLSALIKRAAPPLEGPKNESHKMNQSGVVNA